MSNLDPALTGSDACVREAGEVIDELAERAAARLDSTAAYLRRHDPKIGLRHMRRVIRRHPARIVAGAAAAGFVFGMAAVTLSALLWSSSAALEPSRT